MITLLDHVGIIVDDIDKATEWFSSVLGLRAWRRGVVDIPEEGLKSVLFHIGSAQPLELIQPTEPRSKYRRFLDLRGQGLYHVTLGVDNLDAEIKSLRAKGITVSDAKPITSLGVPIRIAWVDTPFGANIELGEIVKK